MQVGRMTLGGAVGPPTFPAGRSDPLHRRSDGAAGPAIQWVRRHRCRGVVGDGRTETRWLMILSLPGAYPRRGDGARLRGLDQSAVIRDQTVCPISRRDAADRPASRRSSLGRPAVVVVSRPMSLYGDLGRSLPRPARRAPSNAAHGGPDVTLSALPYTSGLDCQCDRGRFPSHHTYRGTPRSWIRRTAHELWRAAPGGLLSGSRPDPEDRVRLDRAGPGRWTAGGIPPPFWEKAKPVAGERSFAWAPVEHFVMWAAGEFLGLIAAGAAEYSPPSPPCGRWAPGVKRRSWSASTRPPRP